MLASAAWAWNSSPINLKDRLFPKHLAEVYPGALYRSGQIDSRLLEDTLADLEIRHIVDLTGLRGADDQRYEQELARQLDIEHRIFTLGGSGTGSVEEYVGAVEAIARAVERGEPVLVHCRAGDRRTGGVVAAYQLLVRGESIERAFDEVGRFASRSVIDSKVWAYLRDNLDEIAEGLRARGIPVATHVTLEPQQFHLEKDGKRRGG